MMTGRSISKIDSNTSPEPPGGLLQLQVWAPEHRALRFLSAAGGIALFFSLLPVAPLVSDAISQQAVRSVDLLLMANWLAILTGISVWAWYTARRPIYLTIQAAGISITSYAGGRVLPWSQVHTVELHRDRRCDEEARAILVLEMPERFSVVLEGYPVEHQDELLKAIVTRAGLQQDSHDHRRFTSDYH